MADVPADARVAALTERLAKAERDLSHPPVPVRDAATLILFDDAGNDGEPALLMGRRNARHVFMPGAFVFPGGRLDPEDAAVRVAGALGADAERRLAAERLGRTAVPQALAVAAVRETFEETGVMVGRRGGGHELPEGAEWAAFASRGIALDLTPLAFVARAITPPGRPRRYDTRFFAAPRSVAAAEDPSRIGVDGELEEVAWVPVSEARRLRLPAITLTVIDELVDRLSTDPKLADARAVPFYHSTDGQFMRELI